MCLKGLARCSWQKGSLLTVQISVSCGKLVHGHGTIESRQGTRTGLRFFLSSESKVPALRAMISGAASGSWAMGEPHSEQKRRWTALPEEPLPDHFLMGPLMVSLSLGTTATRAARR